MFFRRLLPAMFAFCLLACSAVSSGAAQIFYEDFSDSLGGWTRDADWQIGPAVGLPSSYFEWFDPPTDHSPSADNGVAGTMIGGFPVNAIHGYRWLTSPVIDLSSAPGAKQLSFWRWLSTYYSDPDINVRVEVWNGADWNYLWDPATQYSYFMDRAWELNQFDVSGYSNADFRVRFGFEVAMNNPYSYELGVGGWTLDDVRVTSLADCLDADLDGYYALSCGGTDCDDANATIHPDAPELCDGIDNDCDGSVDEGVQTAFYPDADGDGYGSGMAPPQYACIAPPGFVTDNSDCDDTQSTVYPNAVELCDYLDNDCNGLVDESVATEYFFDEDGDGYGNMNNPIAACSQPPGTTTVGGDCNDSNPNIHPGATELENGIDDNCTGGIDEGFETQRIRFVRDVPNDQGRAVRVRFRRNLREIISAEYPDALFANYVLYRRVEPGQAQPARVRPEGAMAANLPPGEWDIAATILATGDTTYQVVVPTLCDSNAAGLCRSVFMVRARWEDQQGFYIEDSAPDSGYSVDNIVPGVPLAFAAEVRPTGNQLTWSAALPPDFQYFRIYRSAEPVFAPGPTNLVHSTVTSNWTDPLNGEFTYQLTVVDANGNESIPAVATAALGVGGSPLATVLSFSSLAPNPFHSSLSLSFDVPRAGRIELNVHDLAGRRVRSLAAGAFAKGRHTVTWDGLDEAGNRARPGVYLLRLTDGERTQTRRVSLIP